MNIVMIPIPLAEYTDEQLVNFIDAHRKIIEGCERDDNVLEHMRAGLAKAETELERRVLVRQHGGLVS